MSIRRLATIGALLSFAATDLHAQVVERPVPFDSAGRLVVMTPYIAQRADLRAPWWPVSGDFTEARMYTVNDSTYVLAVGRRTGVVERYTISAVDRDAIRAIVSRLPIDVITARTDARNSFVKGQSFLGLAAYGPAFAYAIGDNGAGQTAGYLVVAGGTFFAASEISRRISISRPQADLSFNMGTNGTLAGWATMYLVRATDHAQAAGAFVGGLTGTALGLTFARGMTEADAVGAAFGSDVGALIGWGAMEALRGEQTCTSDPALGFSCRRSFSARAEVMGILAAGIVGYPLGLLYPRNARYRVTPGDISTLWSTALVGATTGAAFLGAHSSGRAIATTVTAGGVLGIIAGDRFLVQRYDHSRTDGGRVLLGTFAGGLMGAGVASIFDHDNPGPHLISGFAAVGSLAGIIVTERYLDPPADAGRPRLSVTFNPTGLAALATRTPGNHSLLNVRF
jgi:hypothetical protein